MPKPKICQRLNYNSGGSRFSAFNDYQNEHDDRDEGSRKKERNNTRRVSFKPSQLQPNRGLKNRIAELAMRTRVEDDEDMDGAIEERSKSTPKRRGSPIPKVKLSMIRKLPSSTFGWYQITVLFGQRYAKDDVIRALHNTITPTIFTPCYWRTEKNCVIFFINDYAIAQRFLSERTVQMHDGYRLNIRVRPTSPIVSIDEEYKQKMKLVMEKRYNPSTKALDLSKFHADPDFKNIFCGISRTPVMTAALDIIVKCIPDLEALNLNDNGIVSMEAFKHLETRLPHLKVLYLANNYIISLSHLTVLKNLPLVELMLKANPLRNRYKDHSLYISEVRRRFPKLIKLDGEELEPQIHFDVNDTLTLPRARASFLCDTLGANIVRQFLEQYFTIFDSDNRQPLLDAYHEQAMLSISVPSANQAGRLHSFWKFNRNFLRALNNEDLTKQRQLKVGRLPVVSTLSEWPKTQHDPQSFSVDLTVYTQKLISFTVAGLFKEFDTTGSAGDIRYFQRQFVVVQVGAGYCIRNELIFITSATGGQARTFLKPSVSISNYATEIPSSSSSAIASMQNLHINPPTVSPTTSVALPQLDDTTKLQMIQAMSTQSHMNLEWSRKCLEETNWDYNHATFVFEKLQKENKIPQEAFY